jgi:hypothetical protein
VAITTLNMSALEACMSLMKAESNQVQSSLVRTQDPSYAHFDWLGGEAWKPILISDREKPMKTLLQIACRHFIVSNSLLLKLAGGGRSAITMGLSTDERQVFQNADLLSEFPSPTALLWWDSLKVLSRSDLNEKLLTQGRLAERWTMEKEEEYLISLGSSLRPKWVSLDSDKYGYDIESHRLRPDGNSFTIQIEVKSYSNKAAPHIYLTAYEWNTAKEMNQTYQFYVWCTEDRRMKKYLPDEIDQHVPENYGTGEWQNVLIKFNE